MRSLDTIDQMAAMAKLAVLLTRPAGECLPLRMTLPEPLALLPSLSSPPPTLARLINLIEKENFFPRYVTLPIRTFPPTTGAPKWLITISHGEP